MSLGLIAVGAGAVPAPPPPVSLGAGVMLSIAPLKRPLSAASALVPLPVTIANHGSGPIRVKCRHFFLTDGVGQKSMALLPSELVFERTSSPPLPEGTLSSGQISAGTLYFHLPSTFVSPIELRVDLESADGAVLGQHHRAFVTSPRNFVLVVENDEDMRDLLTAALGRSSTRRERGVENDGASVRAWRRVGHALRDAREARGRRQPAEIHRCLTDSRG